MDCGEKWWINPTNKLIDETIYCRRILYFCRPHRLKFESILHAINQIRDKRF